MRIFTISNNSTVPFFPSFFRLAPLSISVPVVVEIYPGSKVDISVAGTVPMNTSIIRNTSDLVLTSNSALINFYPKEEGNYTCVATSKYGSDSKEFSVIFKGMMKLLLHQLLYETLNSSIYLFMYSLIYVFIYSPQDAVR